MNIKLLAILISIIFTSSVFAQNSPTDPHENAWCVSVAVTKANVANYVGWISDKQFRALIDGTEDLKFITLKDVRLWHVRKLVLQEEIKKQEGYSNTIILPTSQIYEIIPVAAEFAKKLREGE